MKVREVDYPVSDGEPMAETDDHRDEMKDYGIDVLWDALEGDPEVYVSGNNFVYFTQGEPSDCVSPDVYVVRGVPKRRRGVFKVWEEGGKIPSFVLEITSRKTRRQDLGDKMTLYRDEIGVEEYFLFDLRGDWIPEKLRGYVLVDGVYQAIHPLPSGRLPSRTLGLELGVSGGHLRFFPPGADRPLPTRAERAEEERLRADRAEEENRRLREELERLRREHSGS